MEIEQNQDKSDMRKLFERISDCIEEDVEIEQLKRDCKDIGSFDESLHELIKRGIVFESKVGCIKLLERARVLPPKARDLTQEELVKYYHEQIVRSNYLLDKIDKEGLGALHELDRIKGVEWAKAKLDDEIKYFQDKLDLIIKENPKLEEVQDGWRKTD